MIKYILWVLFALPFAANAQFVSCKDSNRVDPYYQCITCYDPVCGCDGVTYRNQCAAEHWGGLVGSTPNTPGVCGNFDFDFAPNPVFPFSQTNTCGNILNIFVNPRNLPTSVQIYLFDIYNRLQYSRYLTLSSSDDHVIPIDDLDVDFFSSLQKGVYILVITVNGEPKTKKVVKGNID